MVKKALVFDLDGTLIDTTGDIVNSINHLRKMAKMNSLGKKKIFAAVGHGAQYLIKTILELGKDENETAKFYLNEFKHYYRDHQGENSAPYMNIPEILKTLSVSNDLYVFSNKPHKAVVREAKIHKIENYFCGIWGAGFFDTIKPDPHGIFKALEISKVEKSHCIYFGDMPVDMETGLRAGVKTCFVSWGYGSLIGDAVKKPDYFASTTADILKIANNNDISKK